MEHGPLPRAVLRIGVTGARSIAPGELLRLREQVGLILDAVAVRARDLAWSGVEFRILSPLAEGADRLVTELALARGMTLVCPLPFPSEEYEKDFREPGSVEAFRALVAHAEDRVLELDGARGDEGRSYEAVGRLVVRNTDLLIGIWDGRPGRGQGGTSDIIRFAARSGPPVVWLHSEDGAARPCWIESSEDLRAGAPRRDVEGELDHYLTLLLCPPAGAEVDHPSLLFRMVARTRSWCRWATSGGEMFHEPAPLAAYVAEWCGQRSGPLLEGAPDGRPQGGACACDAAAPRGGADDPAAIWHAQYWPADELATHYAQRYRWSYRLSFILGAVALSAAAFALSEHEPWPKMSSSCVELVALLGIFGLVAANVVRGWLRRSIEYRLLAELFRYQMALAPLGWSVPRAGTWASGGLKSSMREQSPSESPWLLWLFSAWLRAGPLPTGRIDAHWVRDARDAVDMGLIKEQIGYHGVRRLRCRRRGACLVHLGEGLFIAVLGAVVVKIGMLASGGHESDLDLIHCLGLAGAMLPAVSAAVFGLRAYGELELLAEQSKSMRTTLKGARRVVRTLSPDAPLASQALGDVLADAALAMLGELDGWSQIFREKLVGA